MSRRLEKVELVVVVLAGVVVAAQLVRPERTNPATDVTRTLQAQAGVTSNLAAVVDRACGDCHSNETVWARYPHVAPVSWVIARLVTEGRNPARLSREDVETICAASREAEPRAAGNLHSSRPSAP